MATWYVTFDEPYAIEHHGIKGQKWGIRRFQNPDGTLTELGRQRYSEYKEHQQEKYNKAQAKYEKAKVSGNSRAAERFKRQMNRYSNISVDSFLQSESDKSKAKVAALALAGVAAMGVGTFLLANESAKAFSNESITLRNASQQEFDTAHNAFGIASKTVDNNAANSWYKQAETNRARAVSYKRQADQLAGRSRRATAIADMGRTVGITGMGAAAGAGLWARLKDREDRGKHRRR